jgi:glycosyltransferase involved in cell wall biosynthesis
MGKPLYSVVIRCYNEEQHIEYLLQGILHQTIQGGEIILVDSGSTDDTITIASKYPVEILSINREAFSFGRSLNLGCRAAHGEFIVIASGHVYPVYEDWLENLLQPFTDTKVALVYGKQSGTGSSKYSERQIFKKWYPERSVDRQDHPFCNNANAAIRRDLHEKLPYNEELTGLEDLDLAKRAMQMGYYVAYVAAAEVIHVHNETPLHIYNRYFREGMAHKRIFPEQTFSIWDFIKVFVGNVMADYYHAYRDDALRRSMLNIPLYRLMQFWGTYRGFIKSGPITDKLKRRFYYPNSFKGFPNVDEKDARRQKRIDYSVLERNNLNVQDD